MNQRASHHWKPDTSNITQADLDQIFNSLFATSEQWSSPADSVIDMIIAQADAGVGDGDSLNLSSKITLSIAIRIAAEKYMVEKIDDVEFTSSVRANQTPQLLAKYKKVFPDHVEAIRTIDSVVLMTPEHIHVNSFMYEPILDMSDEHLSRLLADVKSLGT